MITIADQYTKLDSTTIQVSRSTTSTDIVTHSVGKLKEARLAILANLEQSVQYWTNELAAIDILLDQCSQLDITSPTK